MARYFWAAILTLVAMPALASQPSTNQWADDSNHPWYVGSVGHPCKPITIFPGAADPASLEKVLRAAKRFSRRTELPPGGAWIFEVIPGHFLFVVRGAVVCNAVIKGAE